MSPYSTKFRGLALLLLLFFGTQVLFSEFSLAMAPLQQTTDLQKIKDAFTRGEFSVVVEMTNRVLPSFTDEEQRIEVLAMLAYAYYNLDQKNNARDTFRKILGIDINFEPDPTYVSPEKIAFFRIVKNESIAVLVLETVPSNLAVSIDDHPQELRTPNRYRLLDGQHQIVVISPDTKKYNTRKDYKLLEGGKDNPVTIRLEIIPSPPRPIYLKWWFWVGAIVIGVGGYFLLKPDGNGTDGNNTMVLPEPPAHP